MDRFTHSGERAKPGSREIGWDSNVTVQVRNERGQVARKGCVQMRFEGGAPGSIDRRVGEKNKEGSVIFSLSNWKHGVTVISDGGRRPPG